MRYVLIDRIVSLTPGRFVCAIKNVSVSDGLVVRYAPGLSGLPPSMLLEAMAQAAGVLVSAAIHCRAQPVLAKVQAFTAYALATPGDQIRVCAVLRELRGDGCRARARAWIDGRRVADATLYLALVPLDDGGRGDRAGQLRARLADTFPECASFFDAAEVVA